MARTYSKYLFNYFFIFYFFIFTLNFMFFFTLNASGATQVTLEWSPNSEPDLAGYRVYSRTEGQSYDYTNSSWEGTETTCTIYNLDDTKTYYFVARAFDTEGFESGDSNEACFQQTSESGGEKTIEAEDMAIKTTGGSTTDGWNIWSNGYIADDVNFQTEGTYTFDVTAKGSFAGDAWPIMEVRIDQTNVGTVTVDSSNWTVYTIKAYVTSGTHEVAVAFTNDYYNQSEDRNLLIDKIIVTQFGINEPPIADAGPDQTANVDQVITLSGSNSTDPDDGIAAYHWVQTGGSPVTLSNPNGSQTTFTAPDVETTGDTLTFELTVVDHGGLENTDSCVVNVIWLNAPPTAHAGPDQTIDEGRTVTLNGSNSTDPDDGIAAYHWVQTGGSPVTLSDPNGPQVTFTAPDVGAEGATLTFELTVTDYSGIESMDSCLVNVTWLNEPPEADAGPDQTVNEGIVVTLDGTSSLDIDNGIASYLWSQISGPTVTLSDPTASQTDFTTPDVGPEGASLKFNLVITDFGGLQDTDSCIVNISWQNEPPNAVAAEEYIETEEGTVVALDGSGSTDSDDGIASYLWTQVDGTPVSLSGAGSDVATFAAPETDSNGSNLRFKLTVTDTGGLQSSADVYVYVVDMAQADSVTILSVTYAEKPKRLAVDAVSNAPEGTVRLTAWANYGTQKVELGSLDYSPRNKVYNTTFRKIQPAPDTVTVISSGGGSDTARCSN